MKKNKTIFTIFIAIFLGIVSLGMNSSPVKAANTVKLYLNSNSYVYNNKGQRLRGKGNYLKKNKAVTAPGKLQKTNSVKRYYTLKVLYQKNSNNSKYPSVIVRRLPYKVIKGQEYYRIGINKYVKSINVTKINNKKLYTNYETLTIGTPVGNDKYVYATDSNGKQTSKILKTGSKFISDEYDILGNDSYFSYHIKGTEYWVYSMEIKKNPRHTIISNPFKLALWE